MHTLLFKKQGNYPLLSTKSKKGGSKKRKAKEVAETQMHLINLDAYSLHENEDLSRAEVDKQKKISKTYIVPFSKRAVAQEEAEGYPCFTIHNKENEDFPIELWVPSDEGVPLWRLVAIKNTCWQIDEDGLVRPCYIDRDTFTASLELDPLGLSERLWREVKAQHKHADFFGAEFVYKDRALVSDKYIAVWERGVYKDGRVTIRRRDAEN